MYMCVKTIDDWLKYQQQQKSWNPKPTHLVCFDLPLLYDLLNKPNPVNDKTVDNIIYFPNIPKKYLNLLPNMTLTAEGGWV